jgi:predicted permease
MEFITQDIRYALRMMLKNPAFSAVAIVTLALGIGANTAIFTLFDQVLLRRLPVRDPQQLVQLRFTGSAIGRLSTRGGEKAFYFSYPMYRDLRDQNNAFSGLFATYPAQVGLQWHDQPDLADTELVSGNYFATLGVQPALGRLFADSDDVVRNGNPLVVLSFNGWQRRFGSDPHVLGQTLLVNGHPYTVIGVAQRGFHSVVVGDAPDLFIPMTMKPQITPGWDDLDEHQSRWINVFGRLKPGMTRSQAEASFNVLWHSLRAEEYKEIKTKTGKLEQTYVAQSSVKLVDASHGFSPLRENIRTPLLIVMGMVAVVLLIATANIASLLLVRAAGRTREMSIRTALGAARSRILGQLLVEGTLLGVAGGALAVAIALPVSRFLVLQILADSNGKSPFTASPDVRILAFNFALAIGVSLLFSLAPLLQFWPSDTGPALQQRTATASAAGLRFRRAFVVTEIGLSLLLLVASGLFVRTLYNLKTLNVGFPIDHLLTFGIDARLAGYDPKDVPALLQKVTDTLGALPGVRSVAATDDPELAGNEEGSNVTVQGYNPQADEDSNAEWALVTSDYFSALGKTLIAGRAFIRQDGADSSKVAVVNESFARHYFGSAQHALGHYLVSGGGKNTLDIQIVGVVQDARHVGVRQDARRSVFIPFLQAQQTGEMPWQFYVRTSQDTHAAESMIRTTMHNLDSKLVLDTMRTMDEQIDDNLSTERITALLATSFGVLATLLAAIGLYGVLAYATVQRTREIGIRMALGASRVAVARMVLSEVAKLAGIGMLIALPLALLLGRFVKSQLFGISSADSVTLLCTVVLIALVAMSASWIPTRRAMRIDPMEALRYE